MLKKSLLVGGVLVLLSSLFMGRSHILTATGIVKDTYKNSIPVEYELKRARTMLADLAPEIRHNMHVIAKEEVEVEKLVRQVDGAETGLAKTRDDILRLKDDLDRGESTFVYAGRSYSAKQVKADLVNRFARYETQETTTENLRKVLNARQKGLQAAREKLEGMLTAKRQLEVEVENLEARLKMVEVARTTSDFNFDDSRLSRTRELINDIQTRLEVEERMMNVEGRFNDEIPLDDPQEEDITKKIAEKFGDRHAEIEALVRGAAID